MPGWAKPPTAREALGRFLRATARSFTRPDKSAGCLIVLGALRANDASATVCRDLRQHRAANIVSLRDRLQRAVDQGELPEGFAARPSRLSTPRSSRACPSRPATTPRAKRFSPLSPAPWRMGRADFRGGVKRRCSRISGAEPRADISYRSDMIGLIILRGRLVLCHAPGIRP
jgi:hypothetical protein